MEVTYKYRIGQKVRLKEKFNNYKYHWHREKSLEGMQGREVTILDRGFVFEDNTCNFRQYGKEQYELRVFYYIKEDPIIANAEKYSNPIYTQIGEDCFANPEYTRIGEDCFEGEENYETVDEKFFTVDGVEIIPKETKVYNELLCWYEDRYVANCAFGFTNEGIVTGISYNYEYHPDMAFYIARNKRVKIAREFLCYYKPKENGKIVWRQDAAGKGYEMWAYLGEHSEVFAKIPENYPELYVETAFGEGFYSIHECVRANYIDGWEVKEWLTHLGVYDKVKELYYSRIPKGQLENNVRQIVINEFIQDINNYLKEHKYQNKKLGDLSEKEKEQILNAIEL